MGYYNYKKIKALNHLFDDHFLIYFFGNVTLEHYDKIGCLFQDKASDFAGTPIPPPDPFHRLNPFQTSQNQLMYALCRDPKSSFIDDYVCIRCAVNRPGSVPTGVCYFCICI